MTKDDIIRMAREAGLQPYYDAQEPAIEAFANLVAAAQKEADAKLIEGYPYWIGANAKEDIAAAIRGTT